MEIVTISQILDRLQLLSPAGLASVSDYGSYLVDREFKGEAPSPAQAPGATAAENPTELLEWLQEWYLSQCDGNWEHQHGIEISTIDNPGWRVSISLIDTAARVPQIGTYVHDRGDRDWVRCELKEGVFHGVGDPRKLRFILDYFRKHMTSR